MKKPTRSEQEIFADLVALCGSPGYVHAIAQICFRDNIIIYEGTMKEADMMKVFSPKRLIRTEINTLLGLMSKGPIDWNLPDPHRTQEYLDATDRLMEELHQCLSAEFSRDLTKEAIESGTFKPFERGEVLREPMSYGGESAYHFQYLDLAAQRYEADAPWLQEHKGFSMAQASRVAKAIDATQGERANTFREKMGNLHPDKWTVLPFFSFSLEEIAKESGLDNDVVARVLDAFSLPIEERNSGFNALHDFNVVNATPILRVPNGEFLSLQSYALAESIYESPFYWMAADKQYWPTLNKHRGDFTEDFVAERLALVFGRDRVHKNVDVFKGKSKKVSEADVLVLWGNRAVIVQAKSKRLTLESKKGNDKVIRDDFKKAVQDAYDQGAICGKCLLGGDHRFATTDGSPVTLPESIKEVYIFCVVSDHYPALSFQARHFLKTESIEGVQPPLITDVFTIDAMTEMLQSPLHFLSYVNRRTNYADRISASHELPILGYHLTKNLWLEPDMSLVHLSDDFSASLDIAMSVRRAGVPGAATPDGVLTRFTNTTVGRIVRAIEARPDPKTIDLGFLLLAMSEQGVNEMSEAVNMIAARSRADGEVHDATFPFGDGSGITFHCTDEPANVAGPRLETYCHFRKYKEKAEKWFGLCMSSKGPDVRFGTTLIFPWFQDAAMDEQTAWMKQAIPIEQVLGTLRAGREKKQKVGRNDPCPCGSGLKYKKCCIA